MKLQSPNEMESALAQEYELIEEIGRGLTAVVFLAKERKHQRRVAIKVFDAEFATSLGSERFQQEIDIAARLQHPNILPLLDSGAANGVMYYVMPYVEGKSLYEKLQGTAPPSTRDAVRIAREVASALQHAHDAGVVHLDVKPANILLSNGHAMLADFGIAQAICDTCGQSAEVVHGIAGTPGYMSPEQAVGSTRPDERSDVYSLACVLFEMLAGAGPFEGESMASVIERQLASNVASVRGVRPDVSSELDRFIGRALSPDPETRPGSMDDFSEILAAKPMAPPRRSQSLASRSGISSRRRFAARLGIASMVAAALSAIGFSVEDTAGPTDNTALESVSTVQLETAPADSTPGGEHARKSSVC